MRTSLIETKRIDDWLLGQDDPQEHLLMEVKLEISDALKEKVEWQKEVHGLIRSYGRKQLKAEIKSIEHRLFSSQQHRSFQDRVRAIFKL
ncbi:MAG: hypothetical protein RIF33_13550 [Cyclobacteriaceae bacterium]